MKVKNISINYSNHPKLTMLPVVLQQQYSLEHDLLKIN